MTARFLSRTAFCAILIGSCTTCAAAGETSRLGGSFATAVASVLEQADVPACRRAPSRGEAPKPEHASGCLDLPDGHGAREALHSLYARDAGPFWSRDAAPTPQAFALLERLRGAQSYGLRPQDYAVAVIGDLVSGRAADQSGRDDRWAEFDVRLSAAAMRFVSDLHYGRVHPRDAGFHLDVTRRPLDLAAVVAALAATEDTGRVIESIEPPFYHYRLLEQALQRYRELALLPHLTDLPPVGKPLELGDFYAGAPALRRRLAAVGDLPAAAGSVSGSELTIDAALAAGLRRFQTRHGLSADGVLGRQTYAALTTPFSRRVLQIELTLERWRWLPAFETPPIIVNIPEFRLFAFLSTADRKGSILQMDVIVGKTYRRLQTPVFAADMRYVVFRPYWDVPDSITRIEMLPRIRSDPLFIAEQHLQIVRGWSDAAQPLPATPQNIEALASGKLRLRQEPGPDNALGLIKFIFPNAYNVYLHSTPAHALFLEARRTFSHGCIRVRDPVALAEYVLRNEPGDWTRERIEAAMSGTTTRRVVLTKPIRVMILYGTALATEAGDVMFFDDIYGDDRRLEVLLGLRLAPAA